MVKNHGFKIFYKRVLSYLCGEISDMKKTHIIILLGIAALIVGLLAYSVDFSTYDTIHSAQQKQGKFVHLIAKLDKSSPLEYDP